jgi:hypothetical protein
MLFASESNRLAASPISTTLAVSSSASMCWPSPAHGLVPFQGLPGSITMPLSTCGHPVTISQKRTPGVITPENKGQWGQPSRKQVTPQMKSVRILAPASSGA